MGEGIILTSFGSHSSYEHFRSILEVCERQAERVLDPEEQRGAGT